jgi:hypothetical protein
VKNHRFPIAAALLLIGALVLASTELALRPEGAQAAQAKAACTKRAPSAPRSAKKAQKLIRRSTAQLARNYAKGHATIVCTSLTAKALKSLGGSASCVLKVEIEAEVKPISKITIKKLVLRRNRSWVNVSGYLNGNRKQRLAVAFKWERGRYRLDHSLSTLSGLFG